MIALYIILGIFAVSAILFAIACLRAVFIKKEFSDGKPFDMESECVNWKKYAEDLSEMIKVPTVSIRGSDDKTEIYNFHSVLERLYPNVEKRSSGTKSYFAYVASGCC